MDGLVSEGLSSGGTDRDLVAPQAFARFLGLTLFTQDMRERGLVPGSRRLAYETRPADPGVASQLRIPEGDRVVRFLACDWERGAHGGRTVWIPAALVPGLERSDLEVLLYELLARRYQLITGSATVTIEPVLADDATRGHLGIADDQACLRLHMVDSDMHGRVVMVADCVYRGDRYQLSANLAGAGFTSVQARRAGDPRPRRRRRPVGHAPARL